MLCGVVRWLTTPLSYFAYFSSILDEQVGAWLTNHMSLTTHPTWQKDEIADTLLERRAASYAFLSEGHVPSVVYEPMLTPFVPMLMPSADMSVTDSLNTPPPAEVRTLWDLLPHVLDATGVLYSPWEVDLFTLLTAMAPSFHIRVQGVKVHAPCHNLIVAAIRKLNMLGASQLDASCVFRIGDSDYLTSMDQFNFYEGERLLRGPTRPWARSSAEVRIHELLMLYDDISPHDSHIAKTPPLRPWEEVPARLPRALYKLKRRVCEQLNISFNDDTDANVVYVSPDCIITLEKNDEKDCIHELLILHGDANSDDSVPYVAPYVVTLRQMAFSSLRPFFRPFNVHTHLDIPVYGHSILKLYVRPPPEATEVQHADAVFDALDTISGCEVLSDDASHLPDYPESDDESAGSGDAAEATDPGIEDAVRALAVPRVSFESQGARSLSVYGFHKLDMWLDEFVDLNRLQDALRWRSLTCRDAKILTLFDKQDGRHCVNYSPPEETTNPAKKVKKDAPLPTGLRCLSPGVRQFVLQAGTLCIDATDWTGLPDDRSTRHQVAAAVAMFWQRGSEVGLLPSGVRLVSLVPEGFLVRGFLDGPPSIETLETCRAIVRHDVGVDIGELTVVDMSPLPGTSHPLAGDFRLWDEADLSNFKSPVFLAMRKVIENPPHPRAFNWFYETEGNLGKTVHAKYYAQRGACCVSAQTPANIFFAIKDHVQKSGTLRLLIVDVPRDLTGINESFAGAIESIKDGLIFSGKYESGTIKLPSPTVIIFANAPMPDSFRYALSPDRWRELNLRDTPVHIETSRFVLCGDAFPGVYTDEQNYVVRQTLPQRPALSVNGGKITLSTILEGV